MIKATLTFFVLRVANAQKLGRVFFLRLLYHIILLFESSTPFTCYTNITFSFQTYLVFLCVRNNIYDFFFSHSRSYKSKKWQLLQQNSVAVEGRLLWLVYRSPCCVTCRLQPTHNWSTFESHWLVSISTVLASLYYPLPGL